MSFYRIRAYLFVNNVLYKCCINKNTCIVSQVSWCYCFVNASANTCSTLMCLCLRRNDGYIILVDNYKIGRLTKKFATIAIILHNYTLQFQVTVTRYLNNENVSCNATTSEQLLCQIHVDFQSNHRRIANADKHQKVECPEGFDHVGTTCYKLVWPGSTPETIMGSQDGLT